MAIKTDLAEYLHENTDLTLHSAQICAEFAVRWIAETLESGERIELRGLGTFYTVDIPERINNLPTSKKIKAQRKIKFKAGKQLTRSLKTAIQRRED